MKFPSYPKYKESGVEWLGQVPEHWEVKRGRFCMQVNPRTDKLRLLGLDDEVSFVPMDAVGEYGGLRLDTTKPLADIGTGYTEFQNGDVVVAKITPCFENWKGALASSLFNGVAMGTTELHVLRTLQCLDAQFLFYLTLSNGYRKTGEAEMYGAGGQKRVPPEFNKDFRTPLPPLPEQHAIAAFLDAQTAKLDTLIAKKRALIAKLKEKRAALITRTVTRGLPPEAAKAAGLDPNPKMKDSGVEWLGEVPEHWEVAPLFREAAVIKTGPFGSLLHQHDYVEDGIPLVNPAHIVEGVIVADREASVNIKTANRLSQYMIKENDVIFARRGDIGRCAAVEINSNGWICGTGSMFVRLKSSCAKFIAMVCRFSGFCQCLDLLAVGTTMKNINPAILGRISIPLPELREQLAIIAYLDRETSKIDTLISKIESAIAKLQEYRATLITAAVTGKIDVRTFSGGAA